MIVEILNVLWYATGGIEERTPEEQIKALEDLIEIKNREIKRQNKIIKQYRK